MAIVRRSLDGTAPRDFTPEQRARLEAMTEAEIEASALSDPDNPPMTDDMIARAEAGYAVRRTRERLGLTQEAFAARYGISLGRVRDVEQGRHNPDPVLVSYLKLIARDPEWVAETIAGRTVDHAA
ncbi:helix-turn-helix domain-containing protein [Salinarimonas rosea]|uniref:helix-turn-helix domain-containing protein n=1 Tax=Salinarimonas rosea TaxID=552063 RepID=UPI000415454E